MSTGYSVGTSEDPWDWSVEQVIKEFCRPNQGRPVWCSSTDVLPDYSKFERELRENDVTGEVVLTTISKDVLRDDLKIKSIGQRHAIEKGIRYLRSRSLKFQASPANVANAPQFTPLQSWLQASGPPYDQPSNIGGSVQSVTPLGQTLEIPRSGEDFDTTGAFRLNSPNQSTLVRPQGAGASAQQTAIHESAANPPPDAALSTILDGIFKAPTQKKTNLKPSRRVAPTFVAHLGDNTHQSAALSGGNDFAVNSSKVFGVANDDREFNIVGSCKTASQSIGASRRVKKILISFQSEFVRHSTPSSAFRAVRPLKDQEGIHLQGQENNQEENPEFQYLLDKYPHKPDNEDVLTLYGDSGEEGNFDEETWLEIENDAAEDSKNRHLDRALSMTEVNSTIDQMIDKFKSDWQNDRLPQVQAKAYRLWKKANREERIGTEIATAQYWVQRLEQSVSKIRQALTRETWTKSEALQNQCQSLEPSISQQQEYKHNISVLMRKNPPERPDRDFVKRKKPRSVNLVSGDILLESESDLSMSSFINDLGDEPNPETQQPVATATAAVAHNPPSLNISDDSDHIISPMSKRLKGKPQASRIDPRKNPFIVSNPSSTRAASPTAESSSSPGSSSGAGPLLLDDLSEVDSDFDLRATLPKSKYEKFGHDMSAPIELVSSSGTPTPVKARPPQDAGGELIDGGDDFHRSTTARLKINQTSHVLEDIEGIRQTPWETIENESDNRRALAKAVYSLHSDKAARVGDFVKDLAKEDICRVLRHGFEALLKRLGAIEDVEDKDLDTARMTTLLFTSYCLARRVLDEPKIDPMRAFKAQGLVTSGGPTFLKDLRGILSIHSQAQEPAVNRGKRRHGHAGDQTIDTLTSDSDSAIPEHTPGRIKRRRIKESQLAVKTQREGQLRKQEMEQHWASMDQKFQNIPRNGMDPATYAIGVEQPVVHLDPKIGGKVKRHQVDGIRFMWRELITDENKQGCLLAHTMGLGKTMQVISLLVTIAQSVKSRDAGIRKQVPDDLQDLKALILCPPSLIENWYEEILMWRPTHTVLGELYKITQKLKMLERVEYIRRWAVSGGVLIISYDMFRVFIVNKAHAKAKPNGNDRPLSQADHAAIEDHLLNHPNIIIADEAHKMKNAEAGVSMAASRFRSTRRIALTGSPLANNLDEYFSMIDWIAPGYLGTKAQFRSKYANPIADGLWNDSSQVDRRISLRKLHVLKKNLDPKISRADITAIADDLPSKAEFFITIPLTKLQIKAYNTQIAALLGSDEGEATGNARLWDWLAILSLLCNHPSSFLTKLDDRQYGQGKQASSTKNKTTVSTDDVEGAGLPTDIEISKTGLSTALIEQQHKIFQAIEDSGHLEDLSLSHRTQIVGEIIEHSVDAGDKVLLFSHSIPTLDYLEKAISSLGYSSCRLDGSTNVTKRQDAVKEFNKETAIHNVFLISTRAGGLGLNLQGANRVILFDYSFNPIWEEQAVGRAYRLGQRKPVFVYRLRAGGTFEELIYNKAVFKTQLSARVVDKKNPMRFASRKATDYLFPVKEVPQEDLTPYYGKDPLVLDRLLRKFDCIRDITLTETFQREEDESLTPEEVKQANDELKDEQEQRRDPMGHRTKHIEHQGSLLQRRPLISTPNAVRPLPHTPHNQNMTFLPGSNQFQISPLPGTSLISRPEAIGGSQQAEYSFWDHRAPPPHIQSRLQHVLGDPPTNNNFQTSYPSPTTESRPTEVKKAPELPSTPSKQLDGPPESDDDSSYEGLKQCRNQ